MYFPDKKRDAEHMIAASMCEGDLTKAILMNLTDLVETVGITDEEMEQLIYQVRTETAENIMNMEKDYEEWTGEKAGTFTYTIAEAKGGDKDITYDTHTATLTVKVADNGDGTLKVEGTYAGGQTFTNKYTKPTPKTGDTSHPILWIALAAAALIGIATMKVLRRRSTRK